MMAQRSGRVLGRSRSMRVSWWSHRRVADWGRVNRQDCSIAERVVVHRREFHEEVVWVLAVHNRPAECGFTLLKQFRIAPLTDSCGFQAEHRAQREGSVPEFPLCHWHEPVCRKELVTASRAGLLNLIEKQLAM